MLASFASKTLRSALLAILPCVAAAPAFALSPVTHVSNVGTDAGACDSAAAACRTFAYAIGQTAPGGTMKALNAGNFGPFKIEKSITVVGVPGAMVYQNGIGDGVWVAAGPEDVVKLVGLEIAGAGAKVPYPSYNGVNGQSGGKLVIEKCLIRDFTHHGVSITNKTRFLIEDTTVTNVGYHGVSVAANPAIASGALNRVTVDGAGKTGVSVDFQNRVSATDTHVVNSKWGFATAATSRLEIAHSSARENEVGVWHYVTSTIESAGNNFFRDNGVNIAGPSITLVGQQ